MLKKNKGKVIISSIVILLPILIGLIFWNKLPDSMIIHWGADGNGDGFASRVFAVFMLPIILLATHLFCLLITLFDKKQSDQNKKALSIIFWMIPCVSLFANAIMYSAAFGKEYSFWMFMPSLLGIMFIFIGNYLPKIKQNRTLGIKIYWTLNNEENWIKTHRFGGKVWVIGGFIFLLSVLLPATLILPVVVIVTIAMPLLPMVYSYHIYRKHKQDGIVYTATPRSKAGKIGVRISAAILPIILVGVAVIMFTGDVSIRYGTSSFHINATYWSDVEVEYKSVDSIEYREDCNAGQRTFGFGSARLSLGTFQNEEFGTYTRYAYTKSDACIVLEVDGKTLVISGKDKNDTKEIYDFLSSKISK